jgi:hypothetical protein
MMTVTVWPARENLQSFSALWRFEQGQAIAVGNSSADFATYVRSEIERWGKVIAATGIKIK